MLEHGFLKVQLKYFFILKLFSMSVVATAHTIFVYSKPRNWATSIGFVHKCFGVRSVGSSGQLNRW